MTHLYSCTHAGDLYRITKLTTDLDVESSYLVGDGKCQCPGFERRSHCRHLDMLPRFIAREMVGGAYLHDFERNGWVRNPLVAEGGELPAPTTDSEPPITPQMIEDAVEYIDRNPGLAAKPSFRRF